MTDVIIDSPYYIKNPSVVIVSKDTYLNMYDILDNIKDNGIFLLNTEYKEEDLGKILSKKVIDIITKKHLKFYTINASKIARDNNIPLKISMIMEYAIFNVCDIYNPKKAYKEIEKLIKQNFSKKGEDVINANLNAIKEVENSIFLVDIKNIKSSIETYTLNDTIFSYLKYLPHHLLA